MDRKVSEEILEYIKLSLCPFCAHERCNIDNNLSDDDFRKEVQDLFIEVMEATKKARVEMEE
jgi:hypothetical protein